MTRARLPTALAVILLLMFGCREPTGPTPTVPPTQITVLPSSVHFFSLGDTEPFVATLRDANGAVVSGTVTWEVAPTGVASVSSSGMVTAVGNGSATVTARSGTLQASASVYVGQRAASVEISPDPVVLAGPGDEVAVTATVMDARGAEISAAVLTWSSEDPDVATVDETGVVHAVTSGSTSVTVEAAGDGPGVTSILEVTVDDGVAVGPAGGEVWLAGNAVRVALPSGAVAGVVFLSAEPATELPPSPVPIPGTAFDMGPNGIAFDVAVTLTIEYDPAKLPIGVAEEELRLHRLEGEEYVAVAGGGVDPIANVVLGEVGGFSTFAVLPAVDVGPDLTITTSALPNAAPGVPYEAALAASGGVGELTWALVAGALPEGLVLAESGAITGIATGSGTTFTVQVTSGDAQTATRELTIAVNPMLQLTTAALPNGAPTVAYDETLEASGGDGTYAWTVTIGALPQGLALNEGTGAITGTPTGAGTTFTVQVGSGDGQAASVELTLTINPALHITTAMLPEGAVGAGYGPVDLAATGGDGSYAWTVTVGALPEGLGLSVDGAIAGTPTEDGTFDFTVEVASGDGQTVDRALGLTVDPSPPTDVQIQLGDDQVGYPGTTLPFDVEVRVTDASANGVAGIEVSFATEDGGTLNPSSVATGANGVAASTWTLGAASPPESPGWRVESVVASVAALGGASVTFEAEVNRTPGGTVNAYTTGEVGFYGLSDDPEENEFREGGGFDPVPANNLVWLNDVAVVVDSVVIVSQAPISGLVTEGGIRFVAPTDACPAGTEEGELLNLPFRIEVRGRVTEHLVGVNPANCTGS